MAYLDWDPKLNVGSALLDEEHKVLVAIINELHTTILRGVQQEQLIKIFNHLIEHTEAHFKNEEAIMRQAVYPYLVAHHMEHVDFVERIEHLSVELMAGKATVSMDLLRLLKSWLSGHVMRSDQQYAPFLNAENSRLADDAQEIGTITTPTGSGPMITSEQ